MKSIDYNKVVTLHYTVKDNSSAVIDTSLDGKPFQYIHGKNQIIKGLEEKLQGMNAGIKKTIEVNANDAYGNYDPKLVVEVGKDNFASSTHFHEGMQFQAEVESIPGPRIYTIKKIQDNLLVIDGNHPLAGKNLSFQVEIIDIRDATSEELSTSQVLE